MRNFTLVMFLLLLSSDFYAQRLKTFIHPTDGYEIDLPKQWKQYQINDLSLMASGSTRNTEFTKNGVLHVEIQRAAIDSLEIMYVDYIRAIQRSTKVEELGDQFINGRRYKVYYTLRYSGAFPTKELVYLTIKDYKLFTASFTTYQSKFDSLEPLFKRIALTIKY